MLRFFLPWNIYPYNPNNVNNKRINSWWIDWLIDWLIDCSETWVKCSTAKCWRTELRYLSSRDLNMFAKQRTSWSSVNIYFFTSLLFPFEMIKLLKILSLFIFSCISVDFQILDKSDRLLNHSFPIPGVKSFLRMICYLVQTN